MSAEQAIKDAEWLDRHKQIFSSDLENYDLLAESLGCSRQEAMTLQMLSFLATIASESYATAHYARDFHRAQFPEVWEEAEKNREDTGN